MYENYAVLWNRIAARAPHLTAIRADHRDLTYGELEQLASAVADAMASRGVGSGDRVAFFLHNTAEYLVLFYACLKLEAIPVSVNFRYQGTELAALLRVSEPTVLAHGAAYAPAVEEALSLLEGRAAESLKLLVEIGADAGFPKEPGVDRVQFKDLSAPVDGDGHRERRPDPSRDAELYIFTGGTTGTPKAVVWGIGDLLHIQQSSIYGPLGLEPPADLEAAVAVAVDESLPRVRTLPLAPFIHATALFSAMNTLAVGGTVVINPSASLSPAAASRLIVAAAVTRLIVAGDAVVVPLLEALETEQAGSAPSLTSVISSGMRFSDDTKRRIHALGQVSIVDILASTEGGPYATATTTAADELPARFRLTDDAVVLDPGQREVQDEPGAIGVLAYRGALPRGYLNDSEKSEETYPVINGVRHCSPGDYVRVQEHGYIELLGRGSSVVNTGGEKVFPGEVEEVLMGHPGVLDAVVFGTPDPVWGERVTAAVAVDPGASVTEKDLLEDLGSRLAGYKKPRALFLRDTLNRGPSGKLDMRSLKALAARDAPHQAPPTAPPTAPGGSDPEEQA
ncbi:AMP-binding protein [Citricoccus sp. I39-566]|uniref:AMP-binding protein n=1 Tax=Citricoccus sp. I39-566 TaxID=3073268 RepID=UPI00286D2D96|nr:AMP-binding protein [Citricoccus sp. I39-566]WMY79378.1 AMP-binding protein [Citricoccus sp. I39-566]